MVRESSTTISEIPYGRSLLPIKSVGSSTIRSSSCPDNVIFEQVNPVIFSRDLIISATLISAELAQKSNSARPKTRLVLMLETAGIEARALESDFSQPVQVIP